MASVCSRNAPRAVAPLHDVHAGGAMHVQIDESRQNRAGCATPGHRRRVDLLYTVIEVNLTL